MARALNSSRRDQFLARVTVGCILDGPPPAVPPGVFLHEQVSLDAAGELFESVCPFPSESSRVVWKPQAQLTSEKPEAGAERRWVTMFPHPAPISERISAGFPVRPHGESGLFCRVVMSAKLWQGLENDVEEDAAVAATEPAFDPSSEHPLFQQVDDILWCPTDVF